MVDPLGLYRLLSLQNGRNAGDASGGLWERMNFYIALSLMDKSGSYLAELFDTARKEGGINGAQTLFSLVSNLLAMSRPLSEIFQKENEQSLAGLRCLLNEAKPLQIFNQQKKSVQEDFQKGKWGKLFVWCCALLEEKHFEDSRKYLKHAILNQPPETLNSTTVLATLYFTYQLVKSS